MSDILSNSFPSKPEEEQQTYSLLALRGLIDKLSGGLLPC